MKAWKIAHTVTGVSFVLAVGSAVLISPVLIVSLVATAQIFQCGERIRRRNVFEQEKGK